MKKDFIMFFNKLEEDTMLRKNFENSKSLQEAFKVALPYLNNCSFEEFYKCLLVVNSKLSNKLNDAELEAIAGGTGFREVLDYFGNSKRVAALACAAVLTFGGIASNASAMQNDAPIQIEPEEQVIQFERENALKKNWLEEANIDWYNQNPNSNNFQIATPQELSGLAYLVKNGNNFENKTIILTNDLDMSRHIWTPIGNEANTFAGTFNGNRKNISKLITLNETENHQGLFGWNEGTIKNIGVIDSNIKGKDSVGGVVGYNKGIIENSYNTGDVKGWKYIGGVVGCNKGTITNISNKGSVQGNNHVGGVVGYSYEGTIKNISNKGNVKGDAQYTGGVIGYNYEGTTENIYNIGNVEGQKFVGGVAGYIDLKTTKNSYNKGDVKGADNVGGVAGCNKGTIENSYNIGFIEGKNSVGGLVGYNRDQGTIETSYNTGNIEGNSNVGGVTGYSHGGTIKNSYNTGNIEGNNTVGGVAGCSHGGTIANSYNIGNVKGNSTVGGVAGGSYADTIANSYYCNDDGKIKIINDEPKKVGKAKTSDEMKSKDFVDMLGNAFIKLSNETINNGYPILVNHQKRFLSETLRDLTKRNLDLLKDHNEIKLSFNNKVLGVSKLKKSLNKNDNPMTDALLDSEQ